MKPPNKSETRLTGMNETELANIEPALAGSVAAPKAQPDEALILHCSCGSDFKPQCPDCFEIHGAPKAGEPPQTRTVQDDVCREIREIMAVYREQEASSYGVDTPGGLEHMGDVWRLLRRWDDKLAESGAGETPAERPQQVNGIEVRRGFGEIELSSLAEDEFVTASGLHDGGFIVYRRLPPGAGSTKEGK